MFDKDKLDSYFEDKQQKQGAELSEETRHTIWVRHVKLILPSLAAVLLGLLLVYPYLVPVKQDLKLEITKPKKGELEKLHITNTTFYINDAHNKVNNFTAANIDETAPGSKLIKLTNPEGIMPQNNESWINIKAPLGFFNQNDNTLELTSSVDMFYSDGMNVNVESINYNFNTGIGHSDTPVSADGTLGKLNAEGMILYKDKGLLIFTGPAHIVIKEETLQGKRQ